MNPIKKIKIKSLINSLKNISIFLVILFVTIHMILFRQLQVEGTSTGANALSKYIIFSIVTSTVLFLLFLCSIFIIKRLVDIDMPYLVGAIRRLYNFNFHPSDSKDFDPYFFEENNLHELINGIYEEQVFIEEIKNIAANEYVLDDVLDKIFEKLNKFIRVDRIGVAFVDYETRRIIAETGKMSYGNILLGPGFEVKMENTSLSEILISKKPIFINNLPAELKGGRRKNRSLELIVKEGIQSNMILPLMIQDKVFGFLFFSSFEKNSYDKRSLRIGENISRALATIIDQTYLTKRVLNNITLTFADLVEKKDNDTGDHIIRMTKYSKIIAEGLLNHEKDNYRVNSSFIHDIELYAPLHDIGKVGIPDSILNKPGKLTSEEWSIMKEHTNIGANILAKLKENLQVFGKDFYQMAIDVTRHHHEKWDGTGYPYGLKGEEIPLAARIVAIADVFDALSSRRAYKEPMSFEACINMIKKNKGTHFDPELVTIFLDNISKVEEIYNKYILDNHNLKQTASL